MAKHLVLHGFRLVGLLSGDVGTVIEVSPRTPIKKVSDRGPSALARRIVVLSCRAAHTHPQPKNQHGDGARPMGEIALRPGARVERRPHRLRRWEGDPLEFSPDDGSGRKLKPAQHPHFDV